MLYYEQPIKNTVAHILDFSLDEVELFVTPSTVNNLPMRTVSEQAQTFGWDGAINGDGFYYLDETSVAVQGFASSKGVIYSKNTGESTIYISKSNDITDRKPLTVWNAISYPNRLIIDGVVNSNLSNDFVAAWTSVGLTGRNMMWVVTDGIEGSNGLTKLELANYLKNKNLQQAYLFDGGGSSTMFYGGRVVSTPHDTNTTDVVERQVANCLGLRLLNKPDNIYPVININLVL